MISELDIWRAAQFIVRQHGEKAVDEGRSRADALAAAGDTEGAAVWRRIAAAAKQLLDLTPPPVAPH